MIPSQVPPFLEENSLIPPSFDANQETDPRLITASVKSYKDKEHSSSGDWDSNDWDSYSVRKARDDGRDSERDYRRDKYYDKKDRKDRKHYHHHHHHHRDRGHRDRSRERDNKHRERERERKEFKDRTLKEKECKLIDTVYF